MRMQCAILGLTVLTGLAAPALGITGVHLTTYQHTATYALPANLVSEASAVTYDWDKGTLFIQGDNGVSVLEVTKTGTQVGHMNQTHFDDTEGLTYIGGGKFVTLEERIARAYQFSYVANATLDRNALQSVAVGPNTGTNSGNEGISYDPHNNLYFSVKEKDPQNIFRVSANFAGGTSTIIDQFNPALLSVDDLADIQVLTTVPTLIGTADQDNLLILSQASSRLMKVTRTGTVLESIDLSSLSDTIEGVTIDENGVIYLVNDSPTPQLFVLSPAVPTPSVLSGVSIVGICVLNRRRRRLS